jgi:hypothetical protein
MYRFLAIVVAVVLSVLLPQPQTSSQSEIGRVDSVRAPAVLIRDRKVSDLKTGDILHANDVVETGSRGRLRITLKDGSTLNVSQGAEMRVVTHDPANQVTLIEMLHGHLRVHVTSITKTTGSFEMRTPTARVRAIGTVVEVQTDTESARISTVMDQRTIDELPLKGRNFTSLVQLVPGTTGATPDQPSIGDYNGVGSTGVIAEEHFATVTNFYPQISGETDLMPGEFTIVPKGQPPQPATPMYLNGMDYSPEFKDFRLKFDLGYSYGGNRAANTAPQSTTPQTTNPQSETPRRNPDCGRGSVINGAYVPLNPSTKLGTTPVIPKFHYEATGTTGISTGDALQIHFYNDSPCPLKFVVTNGAILRPTGFTGRVVEGLLFGSQPLKNFQDMYTIGGKVYLKPSLEILRNPELHLGGPDSSEEGSLAVPAGTEGTMMLRSYCVELHKLAPHPKSIYKFADEGDQKRFAPNRVLVDRAFHLVLTRQITLPRGQAMDSLVQWMLWKNIEGMDAKKFHEEFSGLVKKNYEAQKKKWDKAAEQESERLEKDLWTNIDKVLAGKD